jgi:hypothetical protein
VRVQVGARITPPRAYVCVVECACMAAFADDRLWLTLAREAGIRLPRHSAAWTTTGARRWLRKLGVSLEAYLDWTGYRRLRTFGALNPGWGLRPWAGILLEWHMEATQPDRFHAILDALPPVRALPLESL